MNRLSDIDWSQWQAKDPATLVFVFRDDEVLLINKKTGLGKGKVNGPGGKVDPGETPEKAAIRECQEELAITVKAIIIDSLAGVEAIASRAFGFRRYSDPGPSSCDL